MTEGAHYWRSSEGMIGVRPLEESGWYCRSSDGRGSSERRRIRLEAEKVLRGLASYELRLELFYTQHQPKRFFENSHWTIALGYFMHV